MKMRVKEYQVKQRLNIGVIIGEAYHLYKNNFRLFFKFSLLIFLIDFVLLSMSSLGNSVFFTVFHTFYILLNLALSLVAYYYTAKIYVGQLFCISDRYNNKETSIPECYNKSKNVVWKFIGTSILLGLILLLPIFGVVFSYLRIDQILTKWIMVCLMAIPLVYLLVIYYLSPVIKVFEPYKDGNFEESKKLIIKNFFGVLGIIAIINILHVSDTILRNFIIDYKQVPLLFSFIHDLIIHSITLFIRPLVSSVLVILYYKLKKRKITEKQ